MLALPDILKINPLTVVYWIVGGVLSGAIVFLGILPWEELQLGITMFYMLGLLFTFLGIALNMARTGAAFDRTGSFSASTIIASFVGIIALLIQSAILKELFGYSLGPTYSSNWLENGVISVLWAIYEETFFLGVSVLLNGIGVPDVINAVITSFVFVPMHALRYPATWMYDAFLTIGRVIMTVSLLAVKNSDVAYNEHIGYNIIVSLKVN